MKLQKSLSLKDSYFSVKYKWNTSEMTYLKQFSSRMGVEGVKMVGKMECKFSLIFVDLLKP